MLPCQHHFSNKHHVVASIQRFRALTLCVNLCLCQNIFFSTITPPILPLYTISPPMNYMTTLHAYQLYSHQGIHCKFYNKPWNVTASFKYLVYIYHRFNTHWSLQHCHFDTSWNEIRKAEACDWKTLIMEVMFLVALVCLFLCLQATFLKKLKWIVMKFYGVVRGGKKNNWLTFGSNLDLPRWVNEQKLKISCSMSCSRCR